MIAMNEPTWRTTSRLISIGVGLFKFTIAVLIGAILTWAYIFWIVIPSIVKEVEIREAKWAIRSAHICGKHRDLQRVADGVWRCERHSFGD